MSEALLWSLVLLALGWWFLYGRIFLTMSMLNELGDIDAKNPASWPLLTVIIPACNEAGTIAPAVSSLLSQDYPALQVIIVNDRSTDDTPAIIDTLAEDARVTALHVNELPENWLGKVHAEKVALEYAQGDWILFTDADVHFKPGTLKKALSYVISRNADHLTLMPDVVTRLFWLQVIIRSFGMLFLFSARVDQLENEKSDAVIGVGAFNLVRHAMLKKSKGLEWLRMEVADDVGVGMLIKQAGGRSLFAMARKQLAVDWYPSVSAMFRGLEKNLFGAGAHYQFSRLLVIVLLMWGLVLSPFILVACVTVTWAQLLGAITLLWIPVLMVMGRIQVQAPLLTGMFIPLGQLVISVMMLRAGIKCLWNGGIDWRGTHYPMKQLKAYQRIRF